MDDEDNGFRPGGLFHLSTTTATSYSSFLLDYGTNSGRGTMSHALTLYRHGSGALVFSAATYDWSWGLDSSHDLRKLGSQTDVNMQQATVNLLADMGVQPGALQPGLVRADASTDTAAPVSRIDSVSPDSGLEVGLPVTIHGSAIDTGGGVVAGIEVSTDFGTNWHPAQGRENWTYTWTPTFAGTTVVLSRAVDDSGNLEVPATAVTVGNVARWRNRIPWSIWMLVLVSAGGAGLWLLMKTPFISKRFRRP